MSEAVAATLSNGIPKQPGVVNAKEVENTTIHELDGAMPLAEDVLNLYKQERDKRLRQDGMNQYVDPGANEKFKHFQSDAWVTTNTLNLGLGKSRTAIGLKCSLLAPGVEDSSSQCVFFRLELRTLSL